MSTTFRNDSPVVGTLGGSAPGDSAIHAHLIAIPRRPGDAENCSSGQPRANPAHAPNRSAAARLAVSPRPSPDGPATRRSRRRSGVRGGPQPRLATGKTKLVHAQLTVAFFAFRTHTALRQCHVDTQDFLGLTYSRFLKASPKSTANTASSSASISANTGNRSSTQDTRTELLSSVTTGRTVRWTTLLPSPPPGLCGLPAGHA